MKKNQWDPRKVSIVGAGAVGATFAYALAKSGLADEITLHDLNEELVKGQVMDLSHGFAYYPKVNISVGKSEDYRDAHVIAITAGAAQQTGQSRLDLLKKNAGIINTIIDDIGDHDSNSVIVVVTNPVDVLTFIAHRRAKWPRGRIIGSGTVLDSARFRYLLSEHCGVDVHNVHAYILGEHGDSQVAAWSMTNIAGVPIDDFCEKCQKCDGWATVKDNIQQTVRKSAYHIIEYKGATNYAVGLALLRIVGTILRNEKSVLTVSVPLDGEYGLSNVCLGVPSVISQNGADSIIEAKLSMEEKQALDNSAAVLQKSIKEIIGTSS